MAEQQAPTPTDGASAPSSSVDDKLAAMIGMSDEPETQPAQENQADEATGELSADDVEGNASPDDQPDAEWAELSRNGERRKVSKEEATRLAQQGWDYSANMERMKADEAMLQQVKQAVVAKAQLHPAVIEARANVMHYERALQQYNGLDWTNLASSDPIQYTQLRAQFDQLREGYGQASQQFQQVANASQQVDRTLSQADIAQQHKRLAELAPDLRDPQRLSAEQGRIVKFMQESGFTQEGAALVNSDALAFSIVRDAMRYRAAVQAKSGKQVNGAPSMRPGVAPQRTNANTQKAETIKALHQAKDPTRKKELLGQALEQKMARFFK